MDELTRMLGTFVLCVGGVLSIFGLGIYLFEYLPSLTPRPRHAHFVAWIAGALVVLVGLQAYATFKPAPTPSIGDDETYYKNNTEACRYVRNSDDLLTVVCGPQ